MADFPNINPKVKYVRGARVRRLKDEEIEALDQNGEMLVVQTDDAPVAVVVGYQSFLDLQALAERGKTAQGGH